MAFPGFDLEKFKIGQEKKDPVLRADLTGKVVIVTGANTGIGYDVAKHFAAMNPKKLILACRSQDRGQAALERLKKETGSSAAELWLLDQSSFASVKAFATKFNDEVDRLDILIENAAVGLVKYAATADGWEEVLQVNNLSPELLTFLLLPKMIKTKDSHKVIPRIVIVTSDLYTGSSIADDVVNSDNLHKAFSEKAYFEGRPMPEQGYMLYKLLNVFFTRALHKHLAPSSSIVVNTLSPGYCESELRRHVPEEQKAQFSLLDQFAYMGEEGARHVVWPALAHAGNEEILNGVYTSVSEILPYEGFVISELGQLAEKKIWDETIQILSQVDDRVSGIVTKYFV